MLNYLQKNLFYLLHKIENIKNLSKVFFFNAYLNFEIKLIA